MSARLSSIEFAGFCIDGLHFEPDGSERHPENTYVNGKTGIYAATANDSVRINGMGFVYLEHALVIHHADALSIHDNFTAVCSSRPTTSSRAEPAACTCGASRGRT
ncbi:hypothetical protein MhomT_12785 [Microbacterium hominis]|nr:hypothetical protein [Microbacterium hominis]KXC05012.1 hypothetical protein MhomT_12785 [Microbacterium hominis]